jgi:Na+-translocating ferredoxin:NAD+ oxidoreductase RnfG subunit
MSFRFPSNLHKKVAKEIKIAFSLEDFLLEEVIIPDSVNTKMQFKVQKSSLFKITANANLIGYAYLDKAPSKTDEFDYLVLFDTDLIIKKAKVLVYREDYGGEIGSKRWLKQFIGKSRVDRLIYEKDIVAISGATISANSMTIAVNKLLQSIDTLHQLKVL